VPLWGWPRGESAGGVRRESRDGASVSIALWHARAVGDNWGRKVAPPCSVARL